jgi:hypothetical protein
MLILMIVKYFPAFFYEMKPLFPQASSSSYTQNLHNFSGLSCSQDFYFVNQFFIVTFNIEPSQDFPSHVTGTDK